VLLTYLDDSCTTAHYLITALLVPEKQALSLSAALHPGGHDHPHSVVLIAASAFWRHATSRLSGVTGDVFRALIGSPAAVARIGAALR